MSGFEVAGLVLGAIPLITSTLKQTEEVLTAINRWKYHRVEVESMRRFVANEETRVKNACMILLDKIGFPSKVDYLLDNLRDKAWHEEEFESRITEKLGDSYQVFEDSMLQMHDAIGKLQKSLEYGPDDPKVSWLRSTFRRESRRVAFVFKRPEHADLKSKISEATARIEREIKYSVKTERSRRLRIKGKISNRSQKASAGVYNALKSSLSCGCAHILHLGLTLPTTTATWTGKETDACQLDFKLVLTYDVAEGSDRSTGGNKKTLKQEVIIRTLQEKKTSLLSTSETPSDTKQTSCALSKPNITASMTGVSTMRTLKCSGTAFDESSPGPQILSETVNLCSRLRDSHSQPPPKCYGVILGLSQQSEWKFSVLPASFLGQNIVDDRSWGVVSLNDILEHPHDFSYASVSTRVNLATILSYSFLQLRQTPWLPRAFTGREVVFLRRSSEVEYKHAFVRAHLPEGSGQSQQSSDANSKELRSLGVLLLELNLGETVQSLRHHYEKGSDRPAPPDDAVIDRAMLRLEKWPGSYGDVVRLCLCGEDGEEFDLSNEDYRQQIYERVVAPLEDDLRSIRMHK